MSTSSSMTRKRKNSKRPIPLVPPHPMKSRKKARVVTSLFHKYTRELEEAKQASDPERTRALKAKIDELGGREAYQQASQLSTSFFSTSKWVLGHLARSGWLYGIHDGMIDQTKKAQRRTMKLLEVGAINTELLDAAKTTKTLENGTETTKYRLSVRAIDLRASHPGIEESDFLTFPLGNYDTVVCSMVLNCVPRPDDRGLMLARLYHQLVPGGLCFLTLPRLCLNQSPFMTAERFEQLLGESGVGFNLEETKQSPKVAFFILRRPLTKGEITFNEEKWSKTKIINKGKKFRNVFDVTLREEDVKGRFSA